MNKVDNYTCPDCGCNSETCNCASEEEIREYIETGDLGYDGGYEDDELEYGNDDDEAICLLNGKPLYIEDIEY